jgi:hypothetical protein
MLPTVMSYPIISTPYFLLNSNNLFFYSFDSLDGFELLLDISVPTFSNIFSNRAGAIITSILTILSVFFIV